MIRALKVIYATHTVPGINVFSLRCAPYRSYVLGVTLADNAYPDALIYDVQQPYHYFRTHVIEGRKLLIAGGSDHKTGHGDPAKSLADLETYLRRYYKISDVVYKWSSQYYVPVDGLPYIGKMPGEEDIYCATGYNGNGMTLGTIASKILSDLILHKKSKYEDVFKPGRIKPVAGFKEFIKENTDVATEFVKLRFSARKIESVQRIKAGTGEIVSIEGKRIAVYKDEAGNIHALNPECAHAQCIVQWNDAEKTWDCPCHGARYDIDGAVLNGPTTRKLEIVHSE